MYRTAENPLRIRPCSWFRIAPRISYNTTGRQVLIGTHGPLKYQIIDESWWCQPYGPLIIHLISQFTACRLPMPVGSWTCFVNDVTDTVLVGKAVSGECLGSAGSVSKSARRCCTSLVQSHTGDDGQSPVVPLAVPR